MQEQADTLGLSLTFFEAIDTEKLSQSPLRARLKDSGPLGLFGLGDMACTLSHLTVFETLLNSNHQMCLILEDDANIAQDLPEFLADVTWIPKDTDIVKLETWVDPKLMVLLGPKTATHLGRSFHPLLSRHAGGAGYIITREGAQKVLSDRAPIDIPIDHLLFNANVSPLARRLKVSQITPALIRQKDQTGSSDIQDHRDRAKSDERAWARELKRGYYEISRLPQQLGSLVFGGARLRKIPWTSQLVSQNETQD